MRKFSSKIDGVLQWLCVRYFAHICYVAGITLLLPVLFLLLQPPPADVNLGSYTVIGLSLVLLSVGLLRRWERRYSDVLVDLGLTTVIPGLIAVVLAFFSRDLLLAWLLPVPGSEKVLPWVVAYVDAAVPTAWLITGLYLGLGVVLIGFGIVRRSWHPK